MTNTGNNDFTASNEPNPVPPVPPPAGGGGRGDGESKRPAWIAPAAIGLVVGLIVALVTVVLTRNDADAPTDDAASETTVIEAETTVDPAVTEPGDTTETTLAPETTVESETTVEPALTTPPEIAAPVEQNGITSASPGMVRVDDQEFPLVRVCASSPMAGFSLTSYLFFDAAGFAEIVEVQSDEGSAPYGQYRGDGDFITDFGDSGFGFLFYEGDGPGVPISLNPTSFGDDCPGSVTLTDPTNPDFPITHLIVDICFGTHTNLASGRSLGYRARVQERGEFTADPNAGASIAVRYIGNDFGADDLEASVAGDEITMIDGLLVGNPDGFYAGESREFSASFDESQVRDCGEFD